MAYTWNTSYAVNVPEIDRQHQELFKRINALLEAMQAQQGSAAITETLRFLESYVVEHFNMEAGLMTRASYPDKTAHLAEHTAFMKDFSEMKAKFAANPGSTVLVLQVQKVLCDWLVNHIKRVDTKLGEFLKVKA